jgi:hypothetical protein
MLDTLFVLQICIQCYDLHYFAIRNGFLISCTADRAENWVSSRIISLVAWKKLIIWRPRPTSQFFHHCSDQVGVVVTIETCIREVDLLGSNFGYSDWGFCGFTLSSGKRKDSNLQWNRWRPLPSKSLPTDFYNWSSFVIKVTLDLLAFLLLTQEATVSILSAEASYNDIDVHGFPQCL